MSIKDYRNRRSSQRQLVSATSTATAALTVHTVQTTSTLATPENLTSSNSSSTMSTDASLHSPAHKIHEAADTLLTPNTVSLRASLHERSRSMEPSSNTFNASDQHSLENCKPDTDRKENPATVANLTVTINHTQLNSTELENPNSDISSKEVRDATHKKAELLKNNTPEPMSTGSNTSVFEPVSPINEEDLKSPTADNCEYS